MNTSAKRLRFGARFMLVSLLAGACATAGAAAADPSPFYSETRSTSEAAPPTPALELRGIMGVPGRMMFNINEPATRLSAWVSIDEPGYAWVIRSHDARNDSVTVEYNGRRLVLALAAARIPSMGSGPAVNASNRFLVHSIDEAGRLEALAVEVAQMRLVREAARQSGNGPP